MRAAKDRLRRNNFDLLRLCLAAAVCVSHAYALSGREQLRWLAQVFSSTVAVRAFFVISGFLIVMSYERSASLSSYTAKRLRRIYPAYFTVVSLSALGLVAVSSADVQHYFTWQWIRYVVFNLSFLNFAQPTLPGVFEFHPYTIVNGALWTLKLEVMFYIAVPLIVHCVRRFGRLPTLLLLYGGSVLFVALLTRISQPGGAGLAAELVRQLPGQLSYFVAGSLLYYYFDTFERHPLWFVVPALLATALNQIYAVPLLEPCALAIIVICLGVFFHVGNFGKYGDFSYGLYIVHFPIIQLAIEFGVFSDRPWLYLLTVIVASGIAAAVMWHLVEKQFLDRTGHYRAATR